MLEVYCETDTRCHNNQFIKSPPTRSHRIMVSTQDFHSCNRSSILLESTIKDVVVIESRELQLNSCKSSHRYKYITTFGSIAQWIEQKISNL